MADELPRGWQERPIEECMAAIIDYRGKSPTKTTFGIPLITAKVVKGGRILNPDEFIAPPDFDDWMRRGLPQAGDVVMTTEAPLGEVAQLDGRRVALAQRLITLRGQPQLLNNTFLKFSLQSRYVQDQLRSRSTGTTVLGIRQSELRKVRLPLPPLDEQLAIAHVLGTLDDKIELNRGMNETLEGVARAIFKSWFVDFDPVRAKVEGRDTGLPQHIADLFPDSFEESGLGRIPEGWTVGLFGDVAENPRRGMQAANIDTSMPYIALEHMPRRCVALADWDCAEAVESNKFAFNRGEILFGKLRPYFHKVGLAPVDGVCSTDILVIRPKSASWFGFVLCHASSVAFVDYADATSTGTKMPRTSWKDIAAFRIVMPPEPLAQVFTDKVRPLTDLVVANVHESRTLAGVRDALLPKLLSGQIRLNGVSGGARV